MCPFGSIYDMSCVCPRSRYDGTNAAEVNAYLGSVQTLHSPYPDPSTFGNAICSVGEVDAVREMLSPAAERMTRGHLVDIVTESGKSSSPNPHLSLIIVP